MLVPVRDMERIMSLALARQEDVKNSSSKKCKNCAGTGGDPPPFQSLETEQARRDASHAHKPSDPSRTYFKSSRCQPSRNWP